MSVQPSTSFSAIVGLPADPESKRSRRRLRAKGRDHGFQFVPAPDVPADVRVWNYLLSSSHIGRFEEGRTLWRDIVLQTSDLGAMHGVTEVRAIHIHVVREDGSVVTHFTMKHNPSSVLSVLGPGNILRVRLFADVKNAVLFDRPKDLEGIAEGVHGIGVVVMITPNGERFRHVFRMPPDELARWAEVDSLKLCARRSKRRR